MAIATTAISSATITAASIAVKPTQRRNKVNYISGLNSFGGLKAQNNVISLGLPDCTENSFAKIVASTKGNGKGVGGALSSTCNVAGEIARIAFIMPALVLVGVAVGFVLLRIEATVEEAE